MKNTCQRAALALCLALGAWQAQACTLNAPGSWNLDAYDPASPPRQAQALNLRVSAGKGCAATLQAEWQGVAGVLPLDGSGPQPLRVMLSTDAAGNSLLPAAPLDISSVQLPAGNETSFVLWARADAMQWLTPGNYLGRLRLRLVGAAGTIDEREIRVTANVAASVRVSFAGTGGKVARLDFGNLAQGAQRSAQLDVQSNTGYGITLQSSQSGRLVNRQFAQSTIPYQLRVGGAQVSTTSSGAGLSIPSAGQARHNIDVEIGAVDRVLAGDYADDLLITITAQ